MTRPDLVPAMFGLSSWEILIILIVALLLFGRRLPEIMRGLGSSVKEFKKGMDDVTSTTPSTTPPPAPPPPAGAVSRDAQPQLPDQSQTSTDAPSTTTPQPPAQPPKV